ncbi:DUF6049 family protein [Microbacterium amylolyticum]|uniref:2-oxoglutarate dehydrogenase n=1 Tax=Microbacterium amylolyticum TaxID=936337 RepID=A0ABS4ZIB7_9MICO|nr:DUF6049 family protein [Microbacterium amylolyticum]MBP2436803.1 hypothetical protein [Microbacterium amylolyticum]
MLLAAMAMGAVLACGGTASAIAAPLPATVASLDEEPAPDADIADRPALRITPTSRGVAADGSLSVTLDIANATTEEFAADDVTLAIGAPITRRGDVAAWLSGNDSPSMTELATVPVDDVEANTAVTLNSALNLEDIPFGVYPLRAQYETGSGAVEARTILIVPDESQPAVTLIVPITGPVDTVGLYAPNTLATLTGADGLLTAQLDAVEGTSAVLAIDPAIPAAIRVLGDAAPASAALWLDRLMELPNERFALQFADADVSSQMRAGLEEPLTPVNLDTYLVGNASADGAGVPEDAPSLDELLAISDRETPQLFWPTPGSVDESVVTSLTDDSDARVLVPASHTASGNTAIGDDTIAYDDALATLLLDAADEDTVAARDDKLLRATAEMWIASNASEQPLLIALDRLGSDSLTTDDEGDTVAVTTPQVTADGLRDAVRAVAGRTDSASEDLTALLSADTQEVALTDAVANDTFIGAVNTFVADEPAIAHTASALVHPAQLIGQVRAEMLRVLSVSWATNPDGAEARAESFAVLTDQRAHAIDIQQPQPVQLLSPEAPMPVWIRNDLAYPARVVITAIPDDPRLSIERRTEVTAQPQSTTRVTIPIEARVGSGQVVVHYSLTSLSGEQIGPARDMDVTVRADWERIGIALFAVLVLSLLGFGAYRQVRRRRRDRAERDEQARQEPRNEAHSEQGMKESE